jgi:hypothetical protein
MPPAPSGRWRKSANIGVLFFIFEPFLSPLMQSCFHQRSVSVVAERQAIV